MKWKFFFLTWLYGVVINTVLITLLLVMLYVDENPFADPSLSSGLMRWTSEAAYIGILSLPFSMPGLLALILATELTRHFMDVPRRFLCIMVFSLAGTFAGYLLIWMVMGINPFSNVMVFMCISFAAVAAALLINKHFFFRVFIPGYKKN